MFFLLQPVANGQSMKKKKEICSDGKVLVAPVKKKK